MPDYYAIAQRTNPRTSFPNEVCVEKLRDGKPGDYDEWYVYRPKDAGGVNWERYWFTNRLNEGNAGVPRLVLGDLVTCPSSVESDLASNSQAGASESAVIAHTAGSGVTLNGTFTGPSTLDGVSDLYYSTDSGAYVEYEIAVPEGGGIEWRTLFNPSVGLDGTVTITTGGGSIPDASWRAVGSGDTRDITTIAGTVSAVRRVLLAGAMSAGTYTVRITRTSGRLYNHSLIATNPVSQWGSEDSPGRRGLAIDVTVSGADPYSRHYGPGGALFKITGAHTVLLIADTRANSGQAVLELYDSNGDAVTPNGSDVLTDAYGRPYLELYDATSQPSDLEVVTGLDTAETYWLFYHRSTLKHASSSGYFVADNGVALVDSSAAGDIETSRIFPVADSAFWGTGNQEYAAKAKQSTGSAPTDFITGTHGDESDPQSLTFTVDESPIDYASGSRGDRWAGSEAVIACTTEAYYQGTSTKWADMSYQWTIPARDAYEVTVTRTIARSDVEMGIEYVGMLQAPAGDSGVILGGVTYGALNGGADYIAASNGEKPVPATGGANASSNQSLSTGAGAYRKDWLMAMQVDDASDIGDAATVSSGIRGLLVDRTDGQCKFYTYASRDDAYTAIADEDTLTVTSRYWFGVPSTLTRRRRMSLAR